MASDTNQRLAAVEVRVMHLEEGQEKMASGMKADLDEMKLMLEKSISKSEANIDSLKEWRIWLTGGAAVLCVLGGVAWTLLLDEVRAARADQRRPVHAAPVKP